MRKKLTYNLWEQLGRAKEDREQSQIEKEFELESSPQSAREQQKGGAVADDDDDGQSTIPI